MSDIGFVGDTCFDGPSVLVHVEGCNWCDWLHGSSGSHDGRRSGGWAIVTVVVVVVVVVIAVGIVPIVVSVRIAGTGHVRFVHCRLFRW